MNIKTFTRLCALALSLSTLSVEAQWNLTAANYSTQGLGLGTSAAPALYRLEIVKSPSTSYTAVFRSAAGGADSYLYHVISTNYHILGSSKNGSAGLKKLGFAVGLTDTESDIKMTIDVNGNVGVGSLSPDAKLAVNGDIHAKEVRVDVSFPAPDYVFEPTYELMPLSALAQYLKKNKHLPEVPAGKELEKNGVNMGEMNMLLLKKVEELTLYMIDQQKIHLESTKKLQQENEALRKRVEALEVSGRR
jgi:hypothetical protein